MPGPRTGVPLGKATWRGATNRWSGGTGATLPDVRPTAPTVLTVNGGDIVRPEDVSIRLRPYTAADHEVDCGVSIMSAMA